MNPFCRQKRHTLSGKLMILYIIMTLIVVALVAAIIGWSFRNHFEESIRPHLTQYLEYIQSDIGSPPEKHKAEALANKLSLEIYYVDDKQQWSTTGEQIELQHIEFYRQFEEQDVEYGFGHYYHREYLISRHDDYTLVFSAPHKRLHWPLKLLPVFVILLALFALYHLTRRLVSPIETLKAGVDRIGSGELSYRLNIQRNDELGELSNSFNEMANDVEQMLEAKRQLLLAISHELRSPITRAKVALELIERQDQTDGIKSDLDEMETLIEELLETERLSTRHHILNKSPTILQHLVQEVLRENFSGNHIELQLPDNNIEMNLDPARIKLLLKNVLDNALKHNPSDAASPQLSIKLENESAQIIIQDHGQGIEEEHLPHLTDPFYRTDKARQRHTGGYGLGLYLCKVIAEAHKGELMIESLVNRGTAVTITLPRN